MMFKKVYELLYKNHEIVPDIIFSDPSEFDAAVDSEIADRSNRANYSYQWVRDVDI